MTETTSPFSSPPDDRLIAQQLSHPTGELGYLIAERMNEANAFMTRTVYSMMKISPESRVLEIGFGNGKLLPLLLNRVPNGQVTGLDISEDMISAAKDHNDRYIRAGTLEILYGSVSAIPCADATFDAVCSMNTLYFWEDPRSDLREVARVMKPGALLYLGIRSRQSMEQHLPFTQFGFHKYEPLEVVALLNQSGFTESSFIQLEEPDSELDTVVVWGRKA